MEREHAKHALKNKILSNYSTRYSGTDNQGSQEFIPNFSFMHKQFNMVQISNGCTCLT